MLNILQFRSEMVKIEHANTLLPEEAVSELDAPPGFPPQTSSAVESSDNQNPTPKENVPQGHEQCLINELSAGQSPRRTSRKRSRPKFYKPPTPRQPEDTLGHLMAFPRRRGRPPKAQLMSLLCQETQTRNGNEVSSVSSLQMTKEQSSSQANNQVVPEAKLKCPSVPPRRRRRLSKPPLILSQLSCPETQTRNSNEVTSVTPVQMTKEQSSSQPNNQVGTEASPRWSTARPCQRGRLPKGRRGRPPKVKLMLSQLSCQEAQTRNGNEVSSVTSVQMSKEQSSSQANDQDFRAPVGKTQARIIDDTLIDENLAHTLEAINKKHGDIVRDCSLESDCMRTLVLVGICKVVQELQKKRLEDFVDASSLAAYYSAVRDGENMKVNVQWLHNRLDEIKYAVNLSNEAKGAVHEKNRLVEEIDRKKKEVERLQSEIQDVREQLARDVVMLVELHNKFSDHTTTISRFEQKGLMDGLL